MSSRGTSLLVVSVQLKTGYLRVACGDGAVQDKELPQLLKQVRNPGCRNVTMLHERLQCKVRECQCSSRQAAFVLRVVALYKTRSCRSCCNRYATLDAGL